MLMQFGQLDDLLIAGNKNDTLIGNVIALYHDSNSAIAAQMTLGGVFYAGRRVHVTLAPAQRLSTSICSLFDKGECPHGDTCHYIHPINPSSVTYYEIFPHKMKLTPVALRGMKKKRKIVHPQDILYGKQKTIRTTDVQ